MVLMTLEQKQGQEWKTVVSEAVTDREQNTLKKSHQEYSAPLEDAIVTQTVEMVAIPRKEWEQPQETIN